MPINCVQVPPSDYEYRLDLAVEFEDVDGYGMVHHTRLVDYLERARVHYFVENGIDLKNIPYHLIVYSIETRFLKPARFLDKLVVEITRVETAPGYLTFVQRILRNDKSLVKAKTRLAFLQAADGAWSPVPDEFERLFRGRKE